MVRDGATGVVVIHRPWRPETRAVLADALNVFIVAGARNRKETNDAQKESEKTP